MMEVSVTLTVYVENEADFREYGAQRLRNSWGQKALPTDSLETVLADVLACVAYDIPGVQFERVEAPNA